MNVRPNSNAAKDAAYVLHPYSNLVAARKHGPLVIKRGRGIHVIDDGGKEYIEGIAGLWYAALGFSENRLVEAAYRQMRELPCYHSFGNKSTEPSIELAETLIGMAPAPMSKVFFANSGSEANDTAFKIVRYYNNALGRRDKKKIVSRVKSYHGTTVATASLTGIPRNHWDFDLPIAGVLHTDCPHHYRFAEPGESEADFAQRLAGNLEALIEREGPETIAAFIAEPVMGSGGIVVPPETYFDRIQAILRRYDILFIADEVICGFGRLGTMFGCQTFDIRPDMISLAKGLSSGYQPISALMLAAPIYETMTGQSEKLGVFGHGFTYSAHPVPAAVALETLRIYEERNILDHVRSIAPRFQRRLKGFADHPLVGEARGIGLIGGLEIVRDKATKQTFDPTMAVAQRIEKLCLTHGLILRALGDTLTFAPPLIIDETGIDEMFDRLARAMDDMLRELPAGSVVD